MRLIDEDAGDEQSANRFGERIEQEMNQAAQEEKMKKWRILNPDEVRRLADAASPKLRPILKLLVTTGMRRTEATKLC